MPELPDVIICLEAFRPRVVGQVARRIRLASPFLLHRVEPPIQCAESQLVNGLRRLGKRIVSELTDELFLIFHLMIAGRFRWRDQRGAKIPRKSGLTAFDFDRGTFILTEAEEKKRESLYLVHTETQLATHHPAGLEVLESDEAAFRDRLRAQNYTLKRALTDPRLFSGIGNTYSGEILHAAQLSTIKLMSKLSDEQITSLYHATDSTL